MNGWIEVGGRQVGPGCPAYLVAEMSANHAHDFNRAVALIRAAKDAGADAVKIQTYTPDTMTIPSNREWFLIGEGTLWKGRFLHDLYREAFMPWEWQPKLMEIADELGIHLFSTAFDPSAVDFLESIHVPVHKISSFEIVDLSLIEKVSRTGKPVILSTGMASLAEIREAVQTARSAGAREIALLKCTSAYPAPPGEMNLRAISDLAAIFKVPVGLSDHTLDSTVPVAAVALGACIIEKHFTLSRRQPSPDSAFSLEPADFKAMVEAVRTTERTLGEVRYGPSPHETASLAFRRSLFVVEDIKCGEPLTEKNVRSIRPGNGLHPRHLKEILGRTVAQDILRGTPLRWDLIADR